MFVVERDGTSFLCQVDAYLVHTPRFERQMNERKRKLFFAAVDFENFAYSILRHRPFYLSVLHDIVRYYTLSLRKSSDANRIVFFFYRAGSDEL